MTLKSENSLPQYLVRPDDFCVFSLNEDGKTYSTHEGKAKFPDSLHHEYSYEVLRSYRFFETTEEEFPELDKKRAEYCEFMIWHNRSDGHGGIKGGTIEEFRELKSIKI